MYWRINNLFPTSVGINTFITIMLLALTTSCDGGALLTTQGTHICLILSFILRGGRIAFISPNMKQDMVPWSIKSVTHLPPNAKLREMQQNTHGLVQLIRAATPHVPNQTPMPQLSKQMLHACPIPPMQIIVRLLAGRQNSILSSNDRKSRGRSTSPTGKGSVHIPNWKEAGPYHQPEWGQSISPTGKGPVHIPDRKGAMQKRGLGLRIKSGPKRCPVRARRADAPPLLNHQKSATVSAAMIRHH